MLGAVAGVAVSPRGDAFVFRPAWCSTVGVVVMRGEDRQPYQPGTVVTPPFPEFISGHSIFSAAGATILERFTGSTVLGASVTLPAGSSRVEPGMVPANAATLAWPTLRDASDQAGIPRQKRATKPRPEFARKL